jgi:PEP-CTERM/exosortase A-associated glycosyltransferase
MRILHILDHSIPLHSGYAFRTLAILREQRALGWETFQLTTPRQGAGSVVEEDVDGWHFYRTPAVPGPGSRLPGFGELREMARTAARIAEVVDAVKPDILHPHSPVLNAFPALWVGHRRGLPVVYEMRASWEDAAVDHGTTTEGSARYRLSRRLETFALRRADQITTICEGLRGDIVARGIPAAKVTVIPNAVDVEAFAAGGTPDAVLRRRLGLDDALVLGFAGSFYGYEGLDLLLDAVPRLLPEHPNLRVLLVGGGPQEDALKAQAARLGIVDRVVFTGRVPHSSVQAHYDLVDVLVYPRRSMRLTDLVTPLKPLEAMAQGRLLVASDVGGHRELIRDGETGVLFAAGSVEALAAAVSRLLAMRGEWERLRRAGRRFVEDERTWKRSVARYAEVYGRVLRPATGGLAASPQG